MNIKINKSDWVKVRLGDVAFEYSKRINNPSDSDYDRFVGSSNIGQWDFRVKSWESTSSVTSSMKLFEPKDYLLVRRSLYASDFRERAPRAHFHGICSGDILTIKENPKYIHDGFLIGVLNSPDLWKYVVANGSGSITRRIHWKDLANYEFHLPPKSQQKQIADLLWYSNELVGKLTQLEHKSKALLDSLFEEETKLLPGEVIELSKVLKIKKKVSKVPHERTKYIGLEHIEPSSFSCDQFQDSSNVLAQCNTFDKGDLCYSKLRPYLDKAFIASFDGVSTTELMIYDTVKGVDKEYILHIFHSKYFLDYISGKGFGTKMPRVNHKIVGEFLFKKLSAENQGNLLSKLKKLRSSRDTMVKRRQLSEQMQKSLINQIF